LSSDAQQPFHIREPSKYKPFHRLRTLRLNSQIDDILQAISDRTRIPISELIRQYIYEGLFRRKGSFPPELKLKFQKVKLQKEKELVKDIRFMEQQKNDACYRLHVQEPFLKGDALEIVKIQEQSIIDTVEDSKPIYAQILKEKRKHATKKQAETQTQAKT
jgi:hypothetical protein